MRKLFALLIILTLVIVSCSLPNTDTSSIDISENNSQAENQDLNENAEENTAEENEPIPPTDAPPPEPPTEPTVTLPSGPAIEHLSPSDDLLITQIDMFTETDGWGIGGEIDPGGHVLVTTDGGLTWQDVTPPEIDDGTPKRAVAAFLDENTAFVIFAYRDFFGIPDNLVVWFTDNRGETWSPVGSFDIDGQADFFLPHSFVFADQQHGWLMASVGAGMSHDYTMFWRTINGGATWELLAHPSTDSYLQMCGKTGLTFLDADTGWLTRNCQGIYDGTQVLITNDGGETWEDIELVLGTEIPDSMPDWFYCYSHSPYLYDSNNAYLGVNCLYYDDGSNRIDTNFLLSTEDGGSSWNIEPAPFGEFIFLGWEEEGFSLSRQIHTRSRPSADWVLQNEVFWDGDFDFVTPTTGWAVARTNDGEIALVYTENAGARWEIMETELRD